MMNKELKEKIESGLFWEGFKAMSPGHDLIAQD
jgi:hypothetical protein